MTLTSKNNPIFIFIRNSISIQLWIKKIAKKSFVRVLSLIFDESVILLNISEMEEEKDVYKLYDIDDIFMLGNNVERDSVVFAAQDKQTQYKCAIRFFYTKPRPDYDQWCGEKVINSNREVLPYYPKNYMDFIGDPDLAFKDKLILMYTICKKMELYHKKGKIHGNIHPGNILVSSNRSTVELMDSLKEGNKNTFYCSP